MRKITKKHLDDLTYQIIGGAIEVHKEMGPGLLEQVYEVCLSHELQLRGLQVERQKKVPVVYKGVQLDTELRYDMLIDDCIVVELKAVQEMHPIYDAQLMTYMRLLHKPKGLLFNFCCVNIVSQGQKTFVNEIYRNLPSL